MAIKLDSLIGCLSVAFTPCTRSTDGYLNPYKGTVAILGFDVDSKTLIWKPRMRRLYQNTQPNGGLPGLFAQPTLTARIGGAPSFVHNRLGPPHISAQLTGIACEGMNAAMIFLSLNGVGLFYGPGDPHVSHERIRALGPFGRGYSNGQRLDLLNIG